MKYTQNYNLRKPEDTDPADIQDLNYNADAIDGKLKEIEDWEAAHLQASNPHSITPALIGAETPAGAQAKVNAHEQKVAPHSGHETPDGAQTKANAAASAALGSANSYTDAVAEVLEKRIDDNQALAIRTAVKPERRAGKHTKRISGYGMLSIPNNANGQVSDIVIKGRSLKNELNYNRDTWVEWSKPAGIIADSTGLQITADNVSEKATHAPILLKGNVKYGILINVITNTLSVSNLGMYSYLTGTPVILVNAGVTGNIKKVITTQATIANNNLVLAVSASEPTGHIIKFRDIRFFELPTGSEIESDFENLTADQLAQKYPYINGDSVKSTNSVRIRSVNEDETKESIAYVNLPQGEELRSLPNGVKDEVNVSTGVKTKKIEPYVLQLSDFVTFNNTTYTNLEWVNIKKPIDFIGYNNLNEYATAMTLLPYKSHTGGVGDDPSHNNEFSCKFYAPYFTLFFTKGTYADLAAAQADLAGLTLTYQLAEPVVTPLDVIGELRAYPNGTVWAEPAIAGFMTEATKVVTTEDYPISEVRKVIRYDISSTGHLVETDVTSDVTVGDNNTSLTIANFEQGKTYFYDCAYPPELTTNGELILDVVVENGIITHDYAAAAADWVLDANEGKATMLICTNAGGAARIIAPACDGKMYVIRNTSGQTITIKTASSTGVTVANGKTATVIFTGNDFIKISEV